MTAVSHLHDVSAQSADAARTVQLARRWRHEGDRDAREQLFVRFLPLARKLAGRYPNAREPLEDLVQVASIGLLGAIDRFDPDREIRFSRSPCPRSSASSRRHFRDTGWSVHVPRGAQELALRDRPGLAQISTDSGRPPQVAQLAEYLEISVEEVIEGLDAGSAHFGLARCSGDDRGSRRCRDGRRAAGLRGRALRAGRRPAVAVGRHLPAALPGASRAEPANRSGHEADGHRRASWAARRCRSRACVAPPDGCASSPTVRVTDDPDLP